MPASTSTAATRPSLADALNQAGIAIKEITSFRRSDTFTLVMSTENPAVDCGLVARYVPVGYWRSLLFPVIPAAAPGFDNYRIALVRLDEISRVVDFVKSGVGGRLRCSNLATQLSASIDSLESQLRMFSAANGTPAPYPLDRQTVATWCVQILPVMLGGPGFGCQGDPATLTLKTVFGQLASLPATRSAAGTYPTPSLSAGPPPLDLAIKTFCNNQILGGGYGAHIAYIGPTDNDYACVPGLGTFSPAPIALAPTPTLCPAVKLVNPDGSFSVRSSCNP